MFEIKLPENLKRLMDDEGLTQKQLAKEIGVSQSAISAWLSGKKEPCINSLWLLAERFDCSVDELIGRKNS